MSEKPKHTEGDWQVSKESSTIITNEHGLIIGSASGYPDSGYFPSNETAVANAVLMAAAPRMLEALEAMVKRIEYYSAIPESERPTIEQWEYTEGSTERAEREGAGVLAQKRGDGPDRRGSDCLPEGS